MKSVSETILYRDIFLRRSPGCLTSLNTIRILVWIYRNSEELCNYDVASHLTYVNYILSGRSADYGIHLGVVIEYLTYS